MASHPTKQERTQRRYEHIRARYKELFAQEIYGKASSRHDVVCSKLAAEFFVTPKTINSIVTQKLQVRCKK